MLKKLKEKIKYLLFMGVTQISLAKTNSAFIWEDKTEDLADSISGPVAVSIGVVSIVVAALMWAFTDGDSMGKAIRIVIALAIVGGAFGLVSYFGLSGGMVI